MTHHDESPVHLLTTASLTSLGGLLLAERLGVSRQTVISIERGRFDPSLPLAFRIAAVFDARIDEIFRPAEDPATAPIG